MPAQETPIYVTRREFYCALSIIWLSLLLLIGQIDWVQNSIIGITWWLAAALMTVIFSVLAIRYRRSK
jgi:hypothetical protein